ncbi:hypothetical protein [Herminiimonas sp. CN]|uniref:hypothetical protein n=1 Tax=Herminiimonas sp. CN TaxID=1349818 RepID=UPI0004736652|nr:hypothetical protein [Herminiimonas sp. CN]
MAAKPETTFYAGVHKHLPADLHREKMHNPYRGGTWDFWFSGLADLWVEYKFVVLPKRDSTPVDVTLSDLQKDWGGGRHFEGRNLAVIVGCKEGGVILENLAWERPLSCADFKKQLRSRVEIARWIAHTTGGPP